MRIARQHLYDMFDVIRAPAGTNEHATEGKGPFVARPIAGIVRSQQDRNGEFQHAAFQYIA